MRSSQCSVVMLMLAAVLGIPKPTVAGRQTLENLRLDNLRIEIQSIHDVLSIYRGDPGQLLILESAPRLAPGPHVELGRQSNSLRILDRSLVDPNVEPESETWHVQLSPIDAARFDVVCTGGTVDFDMALIPVEALVMHGLSAIVRMEFPQPNPADMKTMDVIVESGVLVLKGLLHARADVATIACTNAHCTLEVDGRPSKRDTHVRLVGNPTELQLALPLDIGIRVRGTRQQLAAFRSEHLAANDSLLESAAFDAAPHRLYVQLAEEIRNLRVRWVGTPVSVAQTLPPSSPRSPGPAGQVPAPAAAGSAAVERILAEFTTSLNESRQSIEIYRSSMQRAEESLARMQQQRPDDERLPTLVRWIAEAKEAQRSAQVLGSATITPRTLEGIDRFHAGLRLYLTGQLQEALRAFTDAELGAEGFVPAEAWIRKTRSELDRLSAPDENGATPSLVAPDQRAGDAAPIFAIQRPANRKLSVRSRTVTIAGQVVDDQAVDRIEISLNGESLVDAAGRPIVVRPLDAQHPQQRLDFSSEIPLRKRENQIVVTAYDTDVPPSWTAESFTIVRQPPLYQTSGFLITAAALAVLVLLGVGISRYLKYRIAIVHRYNPYIAGAPIRDSATLYGREAILRTILNTIHHNSIMIYGPRRIGKTSLMHELRRRLETAHDPEYDYVPVMIDLQGVPEDRFFDTMMTEILEVVRTRAQPEIDHEGIDPSTVYSGFDFSRDVRKVLQALSRTTNKTLKLVLLIDEVDVLNSYDEQVNQRLRSVFMKTFAENLVAVMAGVFVNRTWESEGSPWYNFFEQLEVRPLDREDAVRLIRSPVRGIFQYDDDAVEKILEYSLCEPYAIQRLCVHAINTVIDQKRRRVRVRDVIAAHALVESVETDAA